MGLVRGVLNTEAIGFTEATNFTIPKIGTQVTEKHLWSAEILNPMINKTSYNCRICDIHDQNGLAVGSKGAHHMQNRFPLVV